MLVLKQSQTAQIISLLDKSQVGIMPTDTVYGIVCKATDKSSVDRLYKLKLRSNKPGTIIAANIEQLVKLGIKYRYLKAVEQFWPGPISVIVPCLELGYLSLGTSGLAVRIPDNGKMIKILREVGPLLTTSANLTNQPIATKISEAQSYFGELVDFYVNGGDYSAKKPSTIIRIVDDSIEIIREGAAKIT